MDRRSATTATTLTTRMIARLADITVRAGSMTACSSASALGMDLAGVVGMDTVAASVIAAAMATAVVDTAMVAVDMDTVAADTAVDMDAPVTAEVGLAMAADVPATVAGIPVVAHGPDSAAVVDRAAVALAAADTQVADSAVDTAAVADMPAVVDTAAAVTGKQQ
jgi:hypothetical protein